jgi:hypothetical protein
VVEDNGILKNIQNRYIASRYIKYIEWGIVRWCKITT